jgi:hypothetical protein
MRWVSGVAFASAALLVFVARGAAPEQDGDAAPTGPHHLDGAAFSLVVTDWWLAMPAAATDRTVQLIVEVHLPAYPLLDRAIDSAGRKLNVIVLHRGPSARWPKKASERVAVVLPRDYAELARTTGLAITVAGKDRSFPITVPGGALASFLDGKVAAAAQTPTQAAAPASAPAPAPAAAKPAAAPSSSPAAALDSSDAAITPLTDTRVRNAGVEPAMPSAPPVAPGIPPAPPPPLVSLPGSATYVPAPEAPPAPGGEAEAQTGDPGSWVDAIGVQFVPTSSGAMVLATRPGSVAEAKGIESGDFIESVDGVAIKALSAQQMAARIGAPGVKVLHMIAAGDIRIR